MELPSDRASGAGGLFIRALSVSDGHVSPVDVDRDGLTSWTYRRADLYQPAEIKSTLIVLVLHRVNRVLSEFGSGLKDILL